MKIKISSDQALLILMKHYRNKRETFEILRNLYLYGIRDVNAEANFDNFIKDPVLTTVYEISTHEKITATSNAWRHKFLPTTLPPSLNDLNPNIDNIIQENDVLLSKMDLIDKYIQQKITDLNNAIDEKTTAVKKAEEAEEAVKEAEEALKEAEEALKEAEEALKKAEEALKKLQPTGTQQHESVLTYKAKKKAEEAVKEAEEALKKLQPTDTQQQESVLTAEEVEKAAEGDLEEKNRALETAKKERDEAKNAKEKLTAVPIIKPLSGRARQQIGNYLWFLIINEIDLSALNFEYPEEGERLPKLKQTLEQQLPQLQVNNLLNNSSLFAEKLIDEVEKLIDEYDGINKKNIIQDFKKDTKPLQDASALTYKNLTPLEAIEYLVGFIKTLQAKEDKHYKGSFFKVSQKNHSRLQPKINESLKKMAPFSPIAAISLVKNIIHNYSKSNKNHIIQECDTELNKLESEYNQALKDKKHENKKTLIIETYDELIKILEKLQAQENNHYKGRLFSQWRQEHSTLQPHIDKANSEATALKAAASAA